MKRLPPHTHSTRKAAALEVKERMFVGPSHRGPVPDTLYIIKVYRPGARPVWRVSELAPGFYETWTGPFRRTGRDLKPALEALGVEFSPVYPDWLGAPIPRVTHRGR